MFTPEEVRQAVLFAFVCGVAMGSCVIYIWLAIIYEARATQRIPDLSEAASALGKRGRAKQLATQAEKRAAMTERLRQERLASNIALERARIEIRRGLQDAPQSLAGSPYGNSLNFPQFSNQEAPK